LKLSNIALLLASSAFALPLCELIARLILNPVDYLWPVLVRDEILEIRPTGRSGGHDNWGFRNAKVPETAEIVTLGDSHSLWKYCQIERGLAQSACAINGQKRVQPRHGWLRS
jgi:hypothetical protein